MSPVDRRLWLLVSRRCNIRCSFCPIEFTGEDMPLDVARRAIAAYRASLPAGAAPVVKFFGGEPFLNWPVMEAAIEEARGTGLSFQITTNGMFLDAEKLAYLRARPEVEMSLSFRTEGGAQLPGVWFNDVLTQGSSAEAAIDKMRALLADGYRRFNILPAFFTPWSPEELRELDRSFAALSRLFRGLWAQGVDVRLRNPETSSPFPLYNASLTVDVDGQVYSSSLVESRGTEAYRSFLRVGSVDAWPAAGEPRRDGRYLRVLLERWAGPELWRCTREADAALTRFVESLSTAPGPEPARRVAELVP
ncbi:MAG TPA: radical SAM protein [Elusimicrobiota bacterium]|nr:radical SAM protein [Elusimicrobiota bacterium]